MASEAEKTPAVQAMQPANTWRDNLMLSTGFAFLAVALPPVAVVVGSACAWYYVDPITPWAFKTIGQKVHTPNDTHTHIDTHTRTRAVSTLARMIVWSQHKDRAPLPQTNPNITETHSWSPTGQRWCVRRRTPSW
jgi:hypothetical protein